MLIEYVFLIIILIICIAGLFHFWSLISFRKAKERIDKLTIDDFYVEKQDIIKYLDVKDVDRLFEVRKDKKGEIYYFVNGVLYSYGNTHRLSLSITDSDSWERTYRIKQKQYEDFMDYIDGIDKIEVVCKEINITLHYFTISRNKLCLKNKLYYVGKMQIPNLNEDVDFTEEELEKILLAIKEELKDEERLARFQPKRQLEH